MDIALSLHFYLSVYPHIYIKKEEKEKRKGKERKGGNVHLMTKIILVTNIAPPSLNNFYDTICVLINFLLSRSMTI